VTDEQHSEVGKELDDPSHSNESKLNSLRRRVLLKPEAIGTLYWATRGQPYQAGYIGRSGEMEYPTARARGREG